MVLPDLVVGVGSIVFPTPFMLILIEFLAEEKEYVDDMSSSLAVPDHLDKSWFFPLQNVYLGLNATSLYYDFDGGPAHYKNRYNFANLSFFNVDFGGLTAKWFFSASGHEWSKKLERLFKRAIAITGTRSFHSFITTTRPGELIASTLPDPRTVEFDGDWWLGTLEEIFDDSEELIIKFHHPVGSESSAGFHLPKERDELTVHIDRIICVLNRVDLKRRAPRSKFFDLTPSVWEKVCDTYIDFTEYWSSNCNVTSSSEV
ncbi:hypothetical protein OUZ56_024123 [Daphnia magna]|uniref:Uncharacterized protein n=1 Tax=Daphnia magna TaxID=35525 RepID=A0ABR0B084_9CRUS|nr:hypothetical protein OUZ56_024123 [Daphnia magna]